MSRLKLGLFGAARNNDAGVAVHATDAIVAEKRERLSGLTPVEVAAIEAMSRRSEALTAH